MSTASAVNDAGTFSGEPRSMSSPANLRRVTLAAVLLLLLVGCDDAGTDVAYGLAQGADAGVPFPAVTDFGARGPFATAQVASPAKCKVFHPDPLGGSNRRHPVIVWGNGTLGFPAVYTGIFNHWASHGFVVIAANTASAGTGAEMSACLDWLLAEDTRSGSIFAGRIDATRIGASGHSQGGGGAIMLGRDPRVITTAPLMPYVEGLGHDATSQSMQHGPMFLLSGGTDTIAPPRRNQEPVFGAANVPVFWGLLETAGHLAALGDGGRFRGPMTAWFRAELMGDATAYALFHGPSCGLCGSSLWTVRRKDLP